LKKFHDNDLDFPRAYSENSRLDQLLNVLTNTPKHLEVMDVDFGIRLPPDAYFNDGSRTAGGVGLGMCLPLINLSGSEEQKKLGYLKYKSPKLYVVMDKLSWHMVVTYKVYKQQQYIMKATKLLL